VPAVRTAQGGELPEKTVLDGRGWIERGSARTQTTNIFAGIFADLSDYLAFSRPYSWGDARTLRSELNAQGPLRIATIGPTGAYADQIC
jgi:hypothetical protein